MMEKQALTREEYKKLKLAEQKRAGEPAKPVRARRIPVWLRFVILVVLVIICSIAGAIVGYSGIGGGKAVDALKPSTWTHIYDLVEKK